MQVLIWMSTSEKITSNSRLDCFQIKSHACESFKFKRYIKLLLLKPKQIQHKFNQKKKKDVLNSNITAFYMKRANEHKITRSETIEIY